MIVTGILLMVFAPILSFLGIFVSIANMSSGLAVFSIILLPVLFVVGFILIVVGIFSKGKDETYHQQLKEQNLELENQRLQLELSRLARKRQAQTRRKPKKKVRKRQ